MATHHDQGGKQTSEMHHTGEFSPWKRPLQIGAVLLLTGSVTLYYCLHTRPMPLQVLLIGLAQLVVGCLLVKTGLIRWNGKQVEISAVRSFKLPEHWQGKHSYRLPAGGDIDLYLESPAGDRFAIEIKSLESLVVKEAPFGLGKTTLSDSVGRPVRDDPFPQTIRNAEAVTAKPILWLPKARGKTTKLRNGVTVVYGSQNSLLKAVGAPTNLSLW
jgi:hypothetical protein